jgi:hypothetical protein
MKEGVLPPAAEEARKFKLPLLDKFRIAILLLLLKPPTMTYAGSTSAHADLRQRASTIKGRWWAFILFKKITI